MSDSDDERYEQQLVKQREEAEARLREEEEQQRAERRVRKEARAAEKRKQEEELRRRAEEERRQKEEAERQMKAEEERQRQKEAVVQMRRKNWLKKMNPEPLASPPSKEEMNLIDLPPLTKRQRVRYLPKETLEQRREREETARELGIEPMGAGSPCERCANFGILCLPQDLP